MKLQNKPQNSLNYVQLQIINAYSGLKQNNKNRNGFCNVGGKGIFNSDLKMF